MTFLKNLLFCLLFLPVLAVAAVAQETETGFPEPLSDNLSDFASALNATEEGRLSRLLAEIGETTGVQVVVVTAAGLASVNGEGMRLEAFGRALFDAWGIGNPEANDGILILIDTGSREARITLGSGYAPVYDDRAARVLAGALLPELRAGRMAAGIEAGILEVRSKLITPFQAGEPVGPLDGFETGTEGGSWLVGAGFAGVFGLGALTIWRRARARKVCPSCGAASLKRTREVISAPTKFKEGLGLQHITCTACGFVDRLPYPVRYTGPGSGRSRDDRMGPGRSGGPGPDDESDGGFGGGKSGGGKSGGGGAGGKW